jgi:hypothetical protein
MSLLQGLFKQSENEMVASSNDPNCNHEQNVVSYVPVYNVPAHNDPYFPNEIRSTGYLNPSSKRP